MDSPVDSLITELTRQYQCDQRLSDQIIDALKKLGTSAIDALTHVLADHNAWRRAAAAEALGQLGQLALPALTVALDHPDAGVRRLVVYALGHGQKQVPVFT